MAGEAGGGAWACRRPPPLQEGEREGIVRGFPVADRAPFFGLSACPITPEAEERMELVSSVVTGEALAAQWADGVYSCARCAAALYRSGDKFQGPCMWPSFRGPCSPEALRERGVSGYNQYTCDTREIYCGKCELFLGHMFEDGRETGDIHPEARWRHCVLSMSLTFGAS